MNAKNSFDLPKAASLCARAFFNDELDKYFFPEESRRMSAQVLMYRYLLQGNPRNIYTTSERMEGLMILEKPYTHSGAFSIADFFAGMSLLQIGFSSLKKMIHFQINATSIRKRLVRDPYWYLQLIAVAPEHQGRGFASRLLKPILLQAEKEKTPVFLETHNPQNIPIYKNFGFRVVDSIKMESANFYHYCLIK